MARTARVVAPDSPHHISQRGNRRMDAFFSEADYREYLYVMAEWCNRCKVQPLLLLIPNLRELLAGDLSAEEYETLRRHERTGRPLGSADFTEKVEKMTARVLRRQKPGPQKQ